MFIIRQFDIPRWISLCSHAVQNKSSGRNAMMTMTMRARRKINSGTKDELVIPFRWLIYFNWDVTISNRGRCSPIGISTHPPHPIFPGMEVSDCRIPQIHAFSHNEQPMNMEASESPWYWKLCDPIGPISSSLWVLPHLEIELMERRVANVFVKLISFDDSNMWTLSRG